MIKKLAILLTITLMQVKAYAQQTYQLDIKKSKILWDTRKIMGGHNGYIFFKSGYLSYLSTGEPEKGLFTIDMNSMRATDKPTAEGNKKVEKELRTPGFFAVEQFPDATMTVRKIEPINNAGQYGVAGDLTIKGITKAIFFTATIQTKGNQITANADIEFDRNQWNIDMQAKPKQWNFFDAIKDKIVPSNIAVKLKLIFIKK